jgi:hypothetical protein
MKDQEENPCRQKERRKRSRQKKRMSRKRKRRKRKRGKRKKESYNGMIGMICMQMEVKMKMKNSQTTKNPQKKNTR